mgnify:FL=1
MTKEERENNFRDLYIGIGSNVGKPIENVNNALVHLSKLDIFDSMKISSFYESLPMGPSNQNNYINAAAMFKSSESPEDILILLKDIEFSMGRKKSKVRWSERIIDLDIILYGDLVYSSDTLTIPHTNACERAFVLLPVLDIDPNIIIPNKGIAKDLVKSCLYKDIKKIKNNERPNF